MNSSLPYHPQEGVAVIAPDPFLPGSIDKALFTAESHSSKVTFMGTRAPLVINCSSSMGRSPPRLSSHQ